VRKYLAIVLGTLFILSFAFTAFAASPEITLGGKIMVRGWYFDNLSKSFLPEDAESQAFYTTDASITIDAKVSDNVRGFMELETTQGGEPYSGEFIWGRNTYNGMPTSDLYFRQLWIQYTGSGLLGVPAGIKVGHMPLSVGEKQFINHERFGDDAILVWTDPTKELHVAVATAKLIEGSPTDYTLFTSHSQDLDAYVILATYLLDKDNLIGLNYTLLHSDALGVLGLDKVKTLYFQNVGVHADGKVSGLTYAAEFDFQFGKAEGLGSAADQKFRGYGIFAKAGYMIDPVNLRASFAYGSGDNNADDNRNEEFQTLMGPDNISPISRDVNYTQIYERTIRTTAQYQFFGAERNTGIANTTYYNLGVDVNPVKELSLSVDGFIIRATDNVLSGSRTAGSEVDFKGTYKIAKNLSYFVEAGAFWPGHYYRDTFGIDEKTVTQVVHGLSLTF
jgi:hypothetical protein